MKQDFPNKRLFALDALRAVMMLLGLVIHTGVTFMPFHSPVRTIQANETWVGFFPIINLIHSFRMPVFFIVGGYFGSLLFFRKGPVTMLLNRTYKILLPLVAGVLILYPLIYASFIYSSAKLAHETDAWQKALLAIRTGQFLPFRLSHLWFLYDLMIFSVITCLVGLFMEKFLQVKILLQRLSAILLGQPVVRLLTVAILFYIGLRINREYTLHTSVSFWIDRNLLYCYFIFYLIGWMVYQSRLIESLQWKPGLQLTLGLLLFTISMVVELHVEASWSFAFLQLINACITSLLTFGVIGWFLTHSEHYSRSFAYVMDAAYFVYLIHVPIAIIIPGLLASTGWPAIIQFIITFTGTMGLCFGIYQLFVRHKLIGKFLDGKLLPMPGTKSKTEEIKTIA